MDDKRHTERPDLWLTETTTPGLVMQTDVNNPSHTEALYAGGKADALSVAAADLEESQRTLEKMLEVVALPLPIYELRCYDSRPEYPDGSGHESSTNLWELNEKCREANKRSFEQDGIQPWWIVNEQGEIEYPHRTKSGVMLSPEAELEDVLVPLKEVQEIETVDGLNDYFFEKRQIEEQARNTRLLRLAEELETTAAAIRTLLIESGNGKSQQRER